MSHPHSPAVEFFARQFERQIASGEFVLNPFELAALPHLQGEVLDLGCGLGNLTLALAARGARVTAIDACEKAVESLQARVARLGLPVEASTADLSAWRPDRQWDGVACIGLLMFFAPVLARGALAALRDAVRPGRAARRIPGLGHPHGRGERIRRARRHREALRDGHRPPAGPSVPAGRVNEALRFAAQTASIPIRWSE